jgi:hypothetical protein
MCRVRPPNQKFKTPQEKQEKQPSKTMCMYEIEEFEAKTEAGQTRKETSALLYVQRRIYIPHPAAAVILPTPS